jgi:hypothetical protein
MRSTFEKLWFVALPLLFGSSGCSFFYDLNATQCEKTADCLALGPQFANTTCVNQVCVKSDDNVGGSAAMSGAGGGGTGGAGAVSGGGDGDTAGMAGSDTETAGSGGSAGSSVSGGSGGSGGTPPECTTNADCISAHVDQPYVCKTGSCVALTSTDCPILLPSNNTLTYLKTSAPIVIGGYANMNNLADPHDTLAVINWDLAFNEFNTQTLGGLPVKSGDPRPILALICQSGATDITPSLTHLTEDLQVPSILTTLSTTNLYNAFTFTQTSQYAAAGGQPTLFISTGSADLRLASLADNGLVWHMLGDPRVLAATANALLAQITPAVNAARLAAGDDPNVNPLRVTLVYSDDATMTDLFNVLTTPDTSHPEALLTFNGASAISQLSTGQFREVQIQSSKNYTTPVVANAITDLEQHPPHVVIAMATSEFPQTVLPSVESYYTAHGIAKPYYLASHFIYNTPELQTAMSGTPSLSSRLVGVNYAEAQDAHSKQLYDSYEGRLQASYQGSLQLSGTENYYDGAYSMLYSLAAAYAARSTPSGNDVRDGLEDRVFSTSSSATSVDVGPAALATAVNNMSNLTYQMSMWGTMGAPNFDRTSGTRITASSAWCMDKVGTTWTYEADGLIYDTATQTFVAPAAPATVPGCLTAYQSK